MTNRDQHGFYTDCECVRCLRGRIERLEIRLSKAEKALRDVKIGMRL